MMKIRACLFAFTATVLAGCGNPYALKLSEVDYERFSLEHRDAQAAIELSDPQVYAREALINDRLKQAAYLDDKLDESADKKFTPDIFRELSYISALTGSAGVKFDPAAGLAAKRDDRLDELNNDIEETKLRTQLVKAEADLAAAKKAAAEGMPGNSTAGSPTTPTTPGTPTEAATATATDIAKRLTELQDLNTKLLDRVSKLAVPTQVASSPRDELRDRNAYRDEIRGLIAENALDDAHDIRGNSLFRLGFTATVLPGEKLDKWGLISASIEPPKLNANDLSSLYLSWLEHATYRSNDARASIASRDRSYELIAAGTGAFALAKLRFRTKGDFPSIDDDRCWNARSEREAALIDCDTITLAVPPLFKPSAERPFANESDIKLAAMAKQRFVPRDFPADGEGSYACALDDLLLPRKGFAESREEATKTSVLSSQRRMYPDRILAEIGKWDRGTLSEAMRANEKNNAAKDALARVEGSQAPLWPTTEAGGASPSFADYEKVLRGAQITVAMAPFIASSAQGIVGRRDPNPRLQHVVSTLLSRYESAVQDARVVLELANQRANGRCKALSPSRLEAWGRQQIPEPFLRVVLAPQAVDIALGEFAVAGTDTGFAIEPERGFAPNPRFTPSVYTARPLELAQRVSTVANAAQALEIVAAAKATLASSGVSAGGGLGYSRAVSGKVDALERLPLIVAYSSGDVSKVDKSAAPKVEEGAASKVEKSNQSFGWVVGPKARIDADSNKLVLEQGVSSYTVAADLSVPSWWRTFHLKVTTSWIGNWHDGKLGPDRGENPTTRTIPVRLPVTRADLDALSAAVVSELAAERVGYSRIRNVLPTVNSVCGDDSISVEVYGADIWRSTRVTLGGVKADPGSIEVLPDLEGVTASFSRAKLRNRSASKKEEDDLIIWTRSGHDTFPVTLTGKVSANGCIDEIKTKVSKPPVLPAEPGESTKAAKFLVVTPKSLSRCMRSATFAVRSSGLAAHRDSKPKQPWQAFLGSKKATAIPDGAPDSGDSTALISFAELQPRDWAGLTGIPLTVVDSKGEIATTTIQLVGDIAGCGNAAASAPAAASVTPLSVVTPAKLDVCSATASIVLTGTPVVGIEAASLLEQGGTLSPDTPAKGQLTIAFTGLPRMSKDDKLAAMIPLRLKARTGSADVPAELALPVRCGTAS